MNKQKTITYLLIISISLLMINILIDIISKQSNAEPEKTELTTRELKDRFENVIMEFGIDKEWIRIKPLKEKLSDSVSSIYEIRTPQGLPVTVILNELNKNLLDENLTITSKEITKSRVTTLKLLTNKFLMLQADFIPDAELVRKTANLGFIIDDIEKISESKMESILSIPECFALTLVPSERTEKLKKKIIQSGKEYVLLLNDDIDEVRFKLSQEYNEKRLKGSVRNILGSFGESKLFIVDEKSDLFNSPIFKFIKNDFSARSMDLVPLNSFVSVRVKDDRDLKSIFRYYCQSSNSSGNKVFLITADDFIELKSELEAYRKRGYKFVFPSSLKFGLN